MPERKLMKLRGRIIERYGTMGKFADEIGMTKAGLSIKLNRGIFTNEQIRLWAEKLEIEDSCVAEYFLP